MGSRGLGAFILRDEERVAVTHDPSDGGPLQATGSGAWLVAARITAMVMLGLLGVQYLIGMYLNLYVHLSSSPFGMMTMMSGGDGGGGALSVHMMLGMLLALGAVAALVAALLAGGAAGWWAGAGLAGILMAGTGGLLFVMAGHHDGYSFLMATGFLMAIVGYVGELVTTRS